VPAQIAIDRDLARPRVPLCAGEPGARFVQLREQRFERPGDPCQRRGALFVELRQQLLMVGRCLAKPHVGIVAQETESRQEAGSRKQEAGGRNLQPCTK
jgi:hypothetical protein